MKNYNYNQHMDIKFGHQELIDVPQIIKECKEKWFNQTLTKINDSVARLGGAPQRTRDLRLKNHVAIPLS